MAKTIDWSLSPHHLKWSEINLNLMMRGYWVRWEKCAHLHDYRFAVGKEGEGKPMGVFEGEGAAMAVVKILLED